MISSGSRSLNVLHTESSPSFGGQELRILLEMEALVERGIHSVLVARPGTPILAEAARRHLTAYACPMRYYLQPSSLWQLAGLVRKHRIQVVNAHNSKDAWCIAPVARAFGLGIIRARHIANPVRPSWANRLMYGPLCDRVVTTSQSIQKHLVDRGTPEEKIFSIPTGVDIARFESALPGTLRSDLGIPPHVPLIGQVAVVRGDKGPTTFVKAAQRAIELGSNAWFVLVGTGPAKPDVERVLALGGHADRIKLAGFRQDIPQILADLQIFVLAANADEGVPQAILQAHAARRPVITTDRGGINEVAIANETALVVPPKDSEALAQAILRLQNNQALAGQLADGGYQLVHYQYRQDLMLDKMESLYRELAPRA
jgi:glycosyltransferase involved in cell wall biosynthesis